MTQLTTDDLRTIATQIGVPSVFLDLSDGLLLRLVLHESQHLHEQGKFRAFYDTLPISLAIRLMTDSRVVQWVVDNAHIFVPNDSRPTLVERLERAADADIWADTTDDEVLSYAVGDAMGAMLEAAQLLREHGLDK